MSPYTVANGGLRSCHPFHRLQKYTVNHRRVVAFAARWHDLAADCRNLLVLPAAYMFPGKGTVDLGSAGRCERSIYERIAGAAHTV